MSKEKAKIFFLTVTVICFLYLASIMKDHFLIAMWGFNAGSFALHLRQAIFNEHTQSINVSVTVKLKYIKK